jgi:hypothetical protein
MVEKCKYWKFSIMGVEHGEIREMGWYKEGEADVGDSSMRNREWFGG